MSPGYKPEALHSYPYLSPAYALPFGLPEPPPPPDIARGRLGMDGCG